jgi:hypothetical protein
MTKPFYQRLKEYYEKVGLVLRGIADTASVFPNPTDIGTSRERIYAEFLRLHVPSSCNIMFGGFLFNIKGDESRQIDVIVTSDLSLQFNFHNPDGSGKAFSCVDGVLAVASVKSHLDTRELQDVLDGFASIPEKRPIDNKVTPLIMIQDYESWPFKIVYARNGIALSTLLVSLEKYYRDHPDLPVKARPNIIHVGGKYCIVRVGKHGGTMRDGTKIAPHSFHLMADTTDVIALMYVVQKIQNATVSARHILFDYDTMVDHVEF